MLTRIWFEYLKDLEYSGRPGRRSDHSIKRNLDGMEWGVVNWVCPAEGENLRVH